MDCEASCEGMSCGICEDPCYYPIRLLTCGHKFCNVCLKLSTYFFGTGWRCPCCGVAFGLNNIVWDKELRLRIENFVNVGDTSPAKVLHRQKGKKFRSLLHKIVATYGTEQNFKQKAAHIYDAINEKYFSKVRPKTPPTPQV